MRSPIVACLVASSLALTACGANDRMVTAPTTKIDKVVVAPETASVTPSREFQFIGTAHFGSSPVSSAIAWSLSDSNVARITSAGRVTGLRPGTTNVIARSGDAVGAARLSILHPSVDSIVVGDGVTQTIQVGLGSSVSLPAGTFSVGARVRLEEDATLLTSHSQNIGVALRLSATDANQPTASVNRSADGPQPITIHAVAPFDIRTMDTTQQRLVVEVADAAKGYSTIHLQPASVTVRTGPLGNSMSDITVTLDPALVGQSTVVVPAVAAAKCNGTNATLLYRPSNNAASQTDVTRIPLIFVHGLQPLKLLCSSVESWHPELDVWSSLANQVVADVDLSVYEPWIFRYPTFQSISATVQQFESAVQSQIIAPRGSKQPTRNDVVVIAHSMGGLVAGGFMVGQPAHRVERLITLGTPWYGSLLADNPPDAALTLCGLESGPLGLPYILALSTARDFTDFVDGIRDLSTVSPFINAITARLPSIQGRVITYSGDLSSFVSTDPTAPAETFFTWRVLACVMRRMGAPISDGAVSNLSSSASFPNFSFEGAYHTSLTTNGTVTASIPSRLKAMVPTLAPVYSIALSPGPTSLSVGSTGAIVATLKDVVGDVLSGRQIAWTSSDATVATVSSSGQVAAIKAGTTTITATVEGKSGSAQITVTAPQTVSISVNPSTLSIGAAPGGWCSTGRQVLISSTGTGSLNWTAAANVSWISISIQSGTTPGKTSVFVCSGSLPLGTYTGVVTISAPGATAATVTVTFTVS